MKIEKLKSIINKLTEKMPIVVGLGRDYTYEFATNRVFKDSKLIADFNKDNLEVQNEKNNLFGIIGYTINRYGSDSICR